MGMEGGEGMGMEEGEGMEMEEEEGVDWLSTAWLLAVDMAHSLMLCVSTRQASRGRADGQRGKRDSTGGQSTGTDWGATEWLSGTH